MAKRSSPPKSREPLVGAISRSRFRKTTAKTRSSQALADTSAVYAHVCALALPGVELSTSYGTPSIKVKGKIMARLRSEAEGGLAGSTRTMPQGAD